MPKKTSFVTWGVLALIVAGLYGLSNENETVGKARASRVPNQASIQSAKSGTTPAAVQSKPRRPISAWHVDESKDEMSGDVSKYLNSTSVNILEGWLRNGKVLLGMTCGGGFYLRANDVGFTTDNVDCSAYGCSQEQYARVKFDEGEPVSVTFEVWDDNNDGMSLQARSLYPERDNVAYFVEHMKRGRKMFVEVDLFNTKGVQQIAEFDLTGFTSAYNQCLAQ